MQSAQQIGNVYGVNQKVGTSTQNEVQTITGTASGGTFRLRFGTELTVAMPRNESAANIQTALRNLNNISATGVVCAGGPLATAPVTVTFQGEYAGHNVPLLEMVNVDLSGGTVSVAATTAPTQKALVDSDLDDVPAMRARLTAFDGTTYTSAYLDKMTYNDMVWALRSADNPQTV